MIVNKKQSATHKGEEYDSLLKNDNKTYPEK